MTGAPAFVLPRCDCGRQPSIERCEYTRAVVIVCHDCDDADYNGERYVQTNPVATARRLHDAIDEWSDLMWEVA